METKRASLSCLNVAVILIAVVELLLQPVFIHFFKPGNTIIITGIMRLIELNILLGVVKQLSGNLLFISLSSKNFKQGLIRGSFWGIGVGLLIIMGLTGLKFFNPKWAGLFVASVPPNESVLFYFLIVGVIGPVAEELFFRGIIFHTFRNQGLLLATVISTVLFAVFHWNGSFPFAQIIGGILFVMILEKEKNLLSPMIVHCLANLTLLGLSYWRVP